MQSRKTRNSGRLKSWADVWNIYTIRFKTLGRALALNLIAGFILIGLLVLAPFVSGLAAFAGHFWITVIIVAACVIVAVLIYVRSFKIVLGIGDDESVV